MFWWNLAFMAIAGYAVLAIGVEQAPSRTENEKKKPGSHKAPGFHSNLE